MSLMSELDLGTIQIWGQCLCYKPLALRMRVSPTFSYEYQHKDLTFLTDPINVNEVLVTRH